MCILYKFSIHRNNLCSSPATQYGRHFCVTLGSSQAPLFSPDFFQSLWKRGGQSGGFTFEPVCGFLVSLCFLLSTFGSVSKSGHGSGAILCLFYLMFFKKNTCGMLQEWNCGYHKSVLKVEFFGTSTSRSAQCLKICSALPASLVRFYIPLRSMK